MAPGRELTAADGSTIDETVDYLRHCIDVSATQGARAVIGPMYTSVGRTWRMTAHERRGAIARLRESLATVVEHAVARGVALGLEPLNRYETSLINTVEQALEVIDGLSAEGTLGLNLDTYHQNIEEANVAQAVAASRGHLVHMHVCANDRGTPGRDHLDWDAIGRALAAIGFEGMMGIESFTSDNVTLATAASIWRPVADSPDALARDGLAFLTRWRDGFATVAADGRP